MQPDAHNSKIESDIVDFLISLLRNNANALS